jgi:phosphatidylglycerophosphate synthase
MIERKGPQNSPLRKIFSPLTNWGASTLIKAFPNITADHVTNFGLGAAIIGSGLKAIEKISGGDNSLAALGLLMIALILDGLDGPVSEKLKTSSLKGALKDVITDRTQESAMAFSKIITAGIRKDRWGVAAATSSGITGVWPSLSRARVEALGFVVPETGNNPLTVLGRRLPRGIFGAISTSFPEAPLLDHPIQPILDTASSASNLFAWIERVSIFNKAKRGELPKNLNPETQELGKQKTEALSRFNKLNIATMVAAGTIAMINALQ